MVDSDAFGINWESGKRFGANQFTPGYIAREYFKKNQMNWVKVRIS